MKLSSINKEQRLYVIRCGAGYSCYGYDSLNRQAQGVLSWLKEQGRTAELLLGAHKVDVKSLSIPERVGTKKHFAACDAILNAGAQFSRDSGIRCFAELHPQLMGKEGKRVKIIDAAGNPRSFIVGRSSGWLPTHLEVSRRDSSGGVPVSRENFQSVSLV